MSGGELSNNRLRRCRNLDCLYVGQPDPREYPECEERCPRCGTPWDQRPAWKGPIIDDGR
ncbi:hypothetical protein DFAR_3900009 [Desulfarculales bacterium]